MVWNILLFSIICDNASHWLIFFRGVETTNQLFVYQFIIFTPGKLWFLSFLALLNSLCQGDEKIEKSQCLKEFCDISRCFIVFQVFTMFHGLCFPRVFSRCATRASHCVAARRSPRCSCEGCEGSRRGDPCWRAMRSAWNWIAMWLVEFMGIPGLVNIQKAIENGLL